VGLEKMNTCHALDNIFGGNMHKTFMYIIIFEKLHACALDEMIYVWIFCDWAS